MSIVTDASGQRWSDKCDLCKGSHKAGYMAPIHSNECPWCRAVRVRYGNYFYPINKSNEHLFPIDAVKPTTMENNGGKTGWPPGLLQDDCSKLARWLSSRPNALNELRELYSKDEQ